MLSIEKVENGADLAARVEKSEPALYPRERCEQLRRTCMMQARKHKDAGRPRHIVLEWVGHALYWSTRVRTGMKPGDAQAVAYRRGGKWAVRSPAQMAATAQAAAAGMNPPGFDPRPLVPAANVTGGAS